MHRGTIGFDLEHVNRNLAGFSRQVAYVEVLHSDRCFTRMSEETRCFRIHFSGREFLGINSIDLYFDQQTWNGIKSASDQIAQDCMIDPS